VGETNARVEPRSVLVINVSRIGDTLLVTPALRALARHWPGAELTFLGHPKRVEIIAHLPFVFATGAISKHRARWRGWLAAGRRWDLGVVYGFDRALVAYALRVARRVAAFRQGNARLDARLFRCVERPAFQSLHAVDYLLTLTRALGVPDAGRRLAYEVTAAERSWAKALLAARLPAASTPRIGLQVASFPTKAFRDWPIECFATLCARILERWPAAHFLLFGAGKDRQSTGFLARRFPGRVTGFAGALSLRQSTALMNELHLYIGVDTGPTHIMGALEAPMIALYHCHSPSRLLMPLERANCFVVDHPRASTGCGPETPMAEVSVDAVWARVLEAMAGR
jgi:heptosyltransferase III